MSRTWLILQHGIDGDAADRVVSAGRVRGIATSVNHVQVWLEDRPHWISHSMYVQWQKSFRWWFVRADHEPDAVMFCRQRAELAGFDARVLESGVHGQAS